MGWQLTAVLVGEDIRHGQLSIRSDIVANGGFLEAYGRPKHSHNIRTVGRSIDEKGRWRGKMVISIF